jgi:hypothetical protein
MPASLLITCLCSIRLYLVYFTSRQITSQVRVGAVFNL